MSKYPAVLRIQRVNTATIGGLAAHNNRTEAPKFHADGRPHVANNRTKFNRNLVGSGNSKADVEAILAVVPLASKRTTKVCAEAILTADVKYFDSISPNWRKGEFTPEFEKWVEINMQFLNKEFGQGLASIDLHMDETAPHLHAVIVPVATYEVSFRRGSKTVTKVNYNKVLGDDAQVIAQARSAENPEMTKLGMLQTRYAQALEPVGLSRGLMYSNATHRDLEQHRKSVKAPIEKPVRPVLAEINESFTDKLSRAVGIEPEVDTLKAENNAKVLTYRKELGKHQANLERKAKHLPVVIERVSELESALERKQEKLMTANEKVTKLSDELSLKKSEIDFLRKASLDDVAKALDYDGPLTFKNAIDMVKEVGGLDFTDAVIFLYESIGLDACKQAFVQHAVVNAEKIAETLTDELSDRNRKLTPTEFAIKSELGKQLESLDADLYRITLFPGNPAKPTFTLNKREGGGEELYTKDRILDDKFVSYLNYKNWHDEYNIFVTPVDDKKHYILVDDMTSTTLAKLKADGITPSTVLESSKDNFQAVIQVSKDDVNKDDANAFFKQLNSELGDPNIQGLSRPFRAAGFKNMKPKHLDQVTQKRPIVRLLEASVRLCKKAVERILEIASLTSGELTEASNKDLAKALGTIDLGDFKNIDIARKIMIDKDSRGFYSAMKHKYGEGINMSTADFMLCKRLTKAGYTRTECAYAVITHSDSVGVRHPLLSRYIDSTVNATYKK